MVWYAHKHRLGHRAARDSPVAHLRHHLARCFAVQPARLDDERPELEAGALHGRGNLAALAAVCAGGRVDAAVRGHRQCCAAAAAEALALGRRHLLV